MSIMEKINYVPKIKLLFLKSSKGLQMFNILEANSDIET